MRAALLALFRLAASDPHPSGSTTVDILYWASRVLGYVGFALLEAAHIGTIHAFCADIVLRVSSSHA